MMCAALFGRSARSSRARVSRRRSRAFAPVEPLEGRALLASDLSIADAARAVEGNTTGGNAVFIVTLAEPDAAEVRVDFSTNESSDAPEFAKSGVDFAPTSGTLVFPPGTTQQTITVPLIGDTATERDEELFVSLTNRVGGTGTIAKFFATGVIADDDESRSIDAVDDLFAANAATPTSLNVLGNDRGLAGGAAPVVTIVGQPTSGTVTVNGDNTIVYTPTPGISPTIDTFTYRVTVGEQYNQGQVRVVPTGGHLAPDPADPSLTALFVAGDDGANSFKFRKRPGGQVQVLIDRADKGTFVAPTGGIVIVGGNGDDVLSAAGTRNPLRLYGGTGNDRITGGRGNDVLVGGDGNDALNGGAGRDLLVGGNGADNFNGASGDDILIAGTSDYESDSDATRAAVRDLLSVWNSDDVQTTRIAQIKAPGGVGDSDAVLDNTTVFDDAEADTLTGTFSQDAIFANLTGGTATDALKGKRINGNGIGAVTDLGEWTPDTSMRLAVAAEQIGVTPRIVGFNQGYYLPGSSTSGWVDYSQINGFRVWTSPNDFEPENSETFGDGVLTLEDFEARKALVSANPENNGFIPWNVYLDRFENLEISGRNTSKLNYMLAELTRLGVEPIMQITRSENYPFNGWDGAWEQWQHFYAMAYHVAKNYDVTRFQMYNEPDQSGATITMTEWRQRLKLASDAVRTALSDVNRDFGKNLVPDVSAPVIKLGAETALTWDDPAVEDWGKQALIENRIDYAGRTVDYDIFNTYDMHRYADSRPLDWYTRDGGILREQVPQFNASGAMMPFTYTEYNRRSTAGFNNRPAESLDTPQMYTEFGLINLLAMGQDVSGMYAFKFNQTDFSGSPQKTGFYFVSEDGLLDTTGATRAAGVQRLFAKGFAGAIQRVPTADGLENYGSAASFDPATGTYSLMSINLSDAAAADTTIDLGAWGIPAGAVATIEEVSERHHGEVVQSVTVPATGEIRVTQPARSVWLITVAKPAQIATTLTSSEDSHVHNLDASSFADHPTARIARSASDATDDYATYLKFDLGDVDPSSVSRAILNVTGQTVVAPSPSILHVYAMTDDAWSENSITWANAPNLGGEDSRVANVGTTATPVGHLTFDGTSSTTGIDLTEYLQTHPDGVITLAIVREERFAGDGDENAVEIFTSESPVTPPTLTLYQDAAPPPA